MAMILVLALVFTGCSKPVTTPEEKGEPKTDIIIGMDKDIKSLDPHATNDVPSSNALIHIYSRLVTINNEGEIVGDLAKEWSQPTPTQWEFKIHEGVKFHDGTEVKASDVKFSLDRQRNSPIVQYLVDKIKEVTVIDDYTVHIDLVEAYAPLLGNLVHEAGAILPEAAVVAAGDKFIDHPIGSGPFKFISWTPNTELVMERFDDYFAGPVAPKKLTFKVIPEGTSRTIALETGEVDLVQKLEAADIKRLEADPNINVMEKVSISVEQLGFNTQTAPFDNPMVRKAINHAVNKQAIIDVVLEGRGVPSQTVMGMGIPGFNEEIKGYEYDVEKAKALLKEAGVQEGLKVELLATGDLRNRTAQLIQADLAEIGIQVDIVLVDWGAYLDATKTGKYPMHLVGWTNATMDGETSLGPLFHTKNRGVNGNRAFYSNTKVDALLDAATIESDNEKRIEMYKEVQAILVEDAVLVPLYYANDTVAMNKGLKGFVLHPSSAHRYENLTYE